VKVEELRFAKTHEWVHVQSDAAGAKIATVGISSFALEALTDLVFIELPEIGRKVKATRPFGEIESVKAVSDLYSPVDGEIVEVNAAIRDKLEHLADDPYDSGWLVKIKISDEAGLAKLLSYANYQKQCEEEQAEG
jgi:glycine cleavage system H protein